MSDDMKIFREKRQIVICVAIAAMVSGFVLLRYLPLRRKTAAVRSKVIETRLTIAKTGQQNAQLPTLTEKLLKLQSKTANFNLKIPQQMALGEFLHKIANLMNDHNLSDQIVLPTKESGISDSEKFMSANTKLNAIPVKMQCKGRLPQIFEFYKSLQKLDRTIRIDKVKLENRTDYSGEVTMQTTAIIYYRSPAG